MEQTAKDAVFLLLPQSRDDADKKWYTFISFLVVLSFVEQHIDYYTAICTRAVIFLGLLLAFVYGHDDGGKPNCVKRCKALPVSDPSFGNRGLML